MRLLATRLTAIASAVKRLFSPASLFRNAEQGVWYDPSDFSTMFQDSAGTTPVTAVEQPVGLMLDKSRGLVLGSELVTNGTFDNGTTGWTPSVATITISSVSGRLQLVNTTDSSPKSAYQAIPTVIGKWYKATGQYWRISGAATSEMALDVRNTGDPVSGGRVVIQSSSTSSDGSYAVYFAATQTTTFLHARFSNTPAVGSTYEIDNISVRELPGNHGKQETSAARPILKDTGGFYSELFDGVDDSLATTTGGGATTAFFWCSSIKAGKIGAAQTLFSDTGTDTGYRVRINSANKLELAASNGAPIGTPVQAAATTLTTGGTDLAESTAYYYVVTALNALGETVKSNEQTVTTGLGTTNSNTISWAAITGATGYRIYRGTAAGAENVYYQVGAVASYVDTGAASTAGTPPILGETAYVKVASTATLAVGQTVVLTAWDDGTNLNVQIGNGAVASAARPVVSAGTAAITIGKDNGAASSFFLGSIYEKIYVKDDVQTASQIASAKTYCAQKAGVTL